MRIVSRYLLRSFVALFSLCLSVFLFILMLNYFLRLFNVAIMKGISLGWIAFCFARLLPFFLSMVLPIAFLVALLLTLGQHSESGEVLALRSSGFSFGDILAPFLGAAAFLSVLMFWVNHEASPAGFHAFMNSYSWAVSQISRLDLEPRTLTRMGEWEMYADAVKPAESGGQSLGGVRLVKRQGSYKRLRIAAPAGSMSVEERRGVHLDLEQGTLIWPNEDPQSHTASTFGRYRLFVPFVDYGKLARDPELQELDTRRLRSRLASSEIEPHRRREFATEAALRSAVAAAPFVLFWVACPLGMGLEKRGRAKGFALSLALLFGFYGLLTVGIGLGRRDLAYSAWGPWLPNAAGLLAGALLWRRRLAR